MLVQDSYDNVLCFVSLEMALMWPNHVQNRANPFFGADHVYVWPFECENKNPFLGRFAGHGEAGKEPVPKP